MRDGRHENSMATAVSRSQEGAEAAGEITAWFLDGMVLLDECHVA